MKKIMAIISILVLVMINQYSGMREIKNTFEIKEVNQVVNLVSQEEQKDEIEVLEGIAITDKGIVEKGYEIKLEGKSKASLSRDGSRAKEVVDGEVIDLPGEYFLMTWDEANKMSLSRWEILGEWKEVWEIESEEELEEIIKLALDEFRGNLKIKFNYKSLTLEEINQVLYKYVQHILEMYPKLTFEAYTITGKKEEQPLIEVDIKYPLDQKEELREYDKQLEESLLNILSKEIKNNRVDYEREWQIYKYLVEKVQYSAEIIDGERQVIDKPMTHTLYGAIIDGIAVCDGYAKSLMYILNILGIPTELVIGEADGIPHVWNKVEIQDNTYYVDVTWGDLEEKQIGGFYDYFNENTEYMSRTHIWNQIKIHNKYDSNFIYLSLKQDAIEQIQDEEEWIRFQEGLKEEKVGEGSIIFYNDKENQWNERVLISGICMSLGESITYNVVRKYDALIINYKVYVE